MPQFSPMVERVGGEGAAAWDIHYRASRARSAGEDVIVMSVGDPDFATDAGICDAAVAALRAGDTHYAEVIGRGELRELIAARHRERSGQTVTADNVIVLAGAQNALFACSLCLAGDGDELITLEPMYVTYEAALSASGAALRRVPSRADLRPDIDAIAAAITPRTRAIFIATPNNPSGVTMSRDELAAIAELAVAHDLWVVSDEVYADLVFDGQMQHMASLPGMAERCATIGSLSKSHAMTGWRLGWTVAPTELIGHLENLALCMLYGLPGFVQSAGVHALGAARDEPARMREIYRHRRDLLLAALGDIPGLRCEPPQAGMFLLVDVRASGLGSGEFARRLYADCGVSVLDARAFGAATDGYVRISFTDDDARLSEGCRRIADFMRRRPWADPARPHGATR